MPPLRQYTQDPSQLLNGQVQNTANWLGSTRVPAKYLNGVTRSESVISSGRTGCLTAIKYPLQAKEAFGSVRREKDEKNSTPESTGGIPLRLSTELAFESFFPVFTRARLSRDSALTRRERLADPGSAGRSPGRSPDR